MRRHRDVAFPVRRAFKAYYDCLGALSAEDLCCDTAVAPAKQCTSPADAPCAAPYAALLTCSGR